MVEYKLSISMVPQTLWGENLRKYLTRSAWNRLRVAQFERAPNCECCGSSPIGAARHAHEEWDYDIKMATARLIGLRTICRMCHFAEHLGFVQVMVAQGRFTPGIFDEIERHFCNVNECSPKEYQRHRRDAQRLYTELTRIAVWTIDFGAFAHQLVPVG